MYSRSLRTRCIFCRVTMAKLFLARIEKYWKIITILIILSFVVLFALGYYMGPDKMIQKPLGQEPQARIP